MNMFPEECDTDNSYELVLNSLSESTPIEITLLCDAILCNDEHAVRGMSKSLHGDETLSPKREAINGCKAQFLGILLSEDDTIDDSLMTVACETRQREVVSMLLDHGWPINKPLGPNMSILWSVKETLQELA